MGKSRVVERGDAEALRVMGSELSLLCMGTQTGRSWSLMECRAPRDVGPPPHQHDWEEAYYVLEGEVRFSLDGQVRVVKAGGFVHIPQGVVHGFSGASERPARMLILDIPAHTEGFFRDVEREVRELPRDLSKVPEIGDRHGIRFLRP